MNIYKNIDELVGNTPLMDISDIIDAPNAHVFAKLECFNPTGSAKDRAALKMITAAEKSGALKKGSVIIEPTSGNTGIGLAAIGAAKGYRVIIVMPDSMSVERIKLMKAYGAEVVLTDGKKGVKGSVDEAVLLSKKYESAFIPSQFDNPENPNAHYEATGPELWRDMDGNIDIFVAGIGTGGTLSGVGRFLKGKNAQIKVVGVEPFGSPLLTKGITGSHAIQGIGANFVPKNFDESFCDEIIDIKDDEAFEFARGIARKKGIVVGISSGAAICAAARLSRRAENEGKNIAVILPDTGGRYLSTSLFSE